MLAQRLPLLHDTGVMGNIGRPVKRLLGVYQVIRLHQTDSAASPRVPIIGVMADRLAGYRHRFSALALVRDK